MYVAVKGGEFAISQSQRLVAEARRGDEGIPELDVAQVSDQLYLGVSRVMAEGALYDPELAALALKQARGDTVEAVHLLRAFRNTLPRLGMTTPIDTNRMVVRRRISAVFKDVPGGQMLGPTFDYTHRLLDFGLLHDTTRLPGARPVDGDTTRRPTDDGNGSAEEARATDEVPGSMPRVLDLLGAEGLVEPEHPDESARPVGDLTRDPVSYPAARDIRLQNLARGDEGFLLSLGYSTQRGFGNSHPFAGEIRMGDVQLEIVPEELGFPIDIGDICVTECQMVNQFAGSRTVAPAFTARSRRPRSPAARRARRWPWPWWIVPCERGSWASPSRRPPRTRSSSCPTRTTWRPPASCNTSSCPTTSTSSRSLSCCDSCAANTPNDRRPSRHEHTSIAPGFGPPGSP